MRVSELYRIDCTAAMQYNGNFFAMTEDLLGYQKKNFSTVLLVPSRTRAERIAEDLRQSGVRAYFQELNQDTEPTAKGRVLVTPGALQRGFILTA